MDWNGSGSLCSIEHFGSKYKRVCFIEKQFGPGWRLSVPRSLSAWKVGAAHSTGGPTFQSIHQKALFQRWLFHTFVRRKKWKYDLTQAVCSRNNGRHAALSISHSFTSRLEQTIKKQMSDLLGLLSGFPLFHSISINIAGTGPPEICHLKSAIFCSWNYRCFWTNHLCCHVTSHSGAAWKLHHDNVNWWMVAS